MRDFQFKHIGSYKNRQTMLQTPEMIFIFFHVRGLASYKIPGYELENPDPFISFILPGENLSFSFNENRLNWVLQFDSELIKSRNHDRILDFLWKNQRFSLSRTIFLNKEQVFYWENKFEQIKNLFTHPIPKNLLRTELEMYGIFSKLFEENQDAEKIGSVEKLKELIEDKNNFSKTIIELSKDLGLSVDHLRVLFRKKFNISPQEYRIRCRSSFCMELISNTRLSLKEIAFEAGYDYFSHFSAQFVKIYGITASNAIEKYRTWKKE